MVVGIQVEERRPKMNEELRLMNKELRERCTFMQNMVLTVLSLSFLAAFLSACERRELTYPDGVQIAITADWSKAGLGEQENRYGATAIFYPTDGGTPVTVLMGDRNYQTVHMKKGRYNVILFNRSFEDFGGIAFRGIDAHHRLEAYAKNTQTKETDGGKVAIDSPDGLAADCVEGFEVIEKNCLLNFAPAKMTKEITATIHIKGMNNISNATCTLSGVSESVFLASGKVSERTMTQQFELGNPVYLPGSKTEGRMSATFSVFGFDENITHDLHFKALLVDGKTEFEEDLNDIKVNVKEVGEGIVHITIEVVCGETVPTVRPEGSSGMDADVNDWTKEDNTDINI